MKLIQNIRLIAVIALCIQLWLECRQEFAWSPNLFDTHIEK